MKCRHLLILSAGLLLAGNALADEALLKKSGCFACHTVDKKLVGPALKDIAAKYKGTPGAVAHSGKEGARRRFRQLGHGSDGAGPATVSDDDLKEAITYILTLK